MVFKKLRNIIADVMNIEPESIEPETKFTEDLSADSLDLAQIVMEIEEEFDVSLDEEVLTKVKTVKDAVEAINDAIEANR